MFSALFGGGTDDSKKPTPTSFEALSKRLFVPDASLDKASLSSLGLSEADLAGLDSCALEVLKNPGFTKLGKGVVREILSRDTLNVKQESLVAAALLRWVEAHDDYKKLKGEEKRAALGGLVEAVRFPIMSAQEVSSLVSSELLSQNAFIQLFIYITQRKKAEETGHDAKLPALPEPLKGLNAATRCYSGDYELRFDTRTTQNCTVTEKGSKVKRDGSYEASVRGVTPMPNFPIDFSFIATQGSSWSGALMFGLIPKKETVSKACFGAPAYFFDPWHTNIRQKSSASSGNGSTMTQAQSAFKDSGELVVTLHWKPKPGGKHAGDLSFSFSKKGGSQTKVDTVISIPEEGELVPWFGVYGRTESLEVVQV